ncbi:LrgB family protein [Oceanobacillus sp. CAU 1775]
MSESIILILAILGTIGLYLVFVKIHRKINSPLTQPILLTSAFIIIILLIFNIPYDTYMIGGKWIEVLMGPAVVALGIPLYNHFHILKKLAAPILVGVGAGAVVGVLSGVGLAKLLGFEEAYLLAIAPKSVTTPVAISIAETIGGPMALSAIFVVIAGVSGVLISPIIFKLFRLNSTIGRGIGIGSASHAIGTASALGRSELEASLSTIAMVLSAVIVSIITPYMIMFIL